MLRSLIADDSRLAAFGTEVIPSERGPDACGDRLVRHAQTHENVVITPHIGHDRRPAPSAPPP